MIGAVPPMIGWAAATGSLSVEPVLLFLIIFFWTPPHFWALSVLRADEYARAGVPMLPVVKGKDHTRFQILLYTLVLVPLGVGAIGLLTERVLVRPLYGRGIDYPLLLTFGLALIAEGLFLR